MRQLCRPALEIAADSSIKTIGAWSDSPEKAEDNSGGFVTALNSEPLVGVVQLHKGRCITSHRWCQMMVAQTTDTR